jgi:hypothetical protein
MTMQTVTNKLLDDLILTRLLVTGMRPPGPSKLRDDVNRLLGSPPSGEEWQTTLGEMEEAGLLTRKPLTLTDAGRTRALAFLGLEALPPTTDWRAVQSRYLVPRALGVADDAPAERKRLTYANNLRAAALRKAYDLPVPETATLTEALEATACKLICEQMGLKPQSTLAGVQQAVLNQLLNPATPLTDKKLQEHVPSFALGVARGGMQGLREAIVRRWLDVENGESQSVIPPARPSAALAARTGTAPTESPQQAELDLPTFAATVQAIARTCPAGSWGENKVFINHVWRQLEQEANFPRLDLASFKEQLIEAQQRGLLKLERAEMVETMNPGDVRESETTFISATYHFIVVERDRS